MPKFLIEQYELHAQKKLVEADSRGEAIARLLDGDYESVSNGLEFIMIADDFGLPAAINQSLVTELKNVNPPIYVQTCDEQSIIPSIRSIEEIK